MGVKMGLLDLNLLVLCLRAALPSSLPQTNVDKNSSQASCDGEPGSKAVEDACLVCGGHGIACKTVNKIFDEQYSKPGYYDLVLIPSGATNIRITELKESRNYLALRNSTGRFYLYGDWKVNFPHSLTMFGTIFHHDRVFKDFDPNPVSPLPSPSKDTIQALGPIKESIYALILYHEENSGIEIEFSIEKDKGIKVSILDIPYSKWIGSNSTIQVYCNVISDYQSTVFWLKNDNPLEESSRVKTLPDNTLVIDLAQVDDSGIYRCKASNGFNEDEDQIRLRIQENVDGHLCPWMYVNSNYTDRICTFPAEYKPFWQGEDSKSYEHDGTSVRLCECPPPSGSGAQCYGNNTRDEYSTSKDEVEWEDEVYLEGVTCNFKYECVEWDHCNSYRWKRVVTDISEKIQKSLARLYTSKMNMNISHSRYKKKATNTNSVLEEVFYEAVNDDNNLRNITKQHLLALHNKITRDEADAMQGQFRDASVKVWSRGVETYFPPADKVEELMKDYLQWLNSKEDTENPVVKAVMACFKFLNIHPFMDGNGRMGRLLMNILLVRVGFPPVELTRKYRAEFGDALAEHMIGRDPTVYTKPVMEDMLAFIILITKRLEETMEKLAGSGDLTFGGYTDMHRP